MSVGNEQCQTLSWQNGCLQTILTDQRRIGRSPYIRKIEDFPNERCGIEAIMNPNRILYEDNYILVCHKPAGIATQTARIGQADMVSEMENYLARNLSKGSVRSEWKAKTPGSRYVEAPQRPHIHVIHRLDQPVEGILVFAKQKAAAASLSAQAAGEGMKKEYLALAFDLRGEEMAGAIQGDGQAAEQRQEGRQVLSGVLTDYLLKDGKTNTSRVVPPEVKGAKEARLSFAILSQIAAEEGKEKGSVRIQDLPQIMLVRICLHTGRHHQIRVQMANAGMPLLGDRKYAGQQAAAFSEKLGIRETALCAYRLAFTHPKTGECMQFEIQPESAAFQGIRF